MESTLQQATRNPAGSALRRQFDLLVRAEQLLWKACERALRDELGTPLARYEVLRAISARNECRVQEIAGDLLITIGAASKLVDRLAAAGLCDRRPNPVDGRSSLVRATAAGRALLRRGEPLIQARLQALIPADAPSADQLQRLVDHLGGFSEPTVAGHG